MAGVMMTATRSEATIARTYDTARGRKNTPASPGRKKTGRKTRMTSRLPYSTALRTSRLASSTTSSAGRGSASAG
jgi:hypothetical protein